MRRAPEPVRGVFVGGPLGDRVMTYLEREPAVVGETRQFSHPDDVRLLPPTFPYVRSADTAPGLPVWYCLHTGEPNPRAVAMAVERWLERAHLHLSPAYVTDLKTWLATGKDPDTRHAKPQGMALPPGMTLVVAIGDAHAAHLQELPMAVCACGDPGCRGCSKSMGRLD